MAAVPDLVITIEADASAFDAAVAHMTDLMADLVDVTERMRRAMGLSEAEFARLMDRLANSRCERAGRRRVEQAMRLRARRAARRQRRAAARASRAAA